jgi:uncharacterized protein (TIGR02246 family)
MFWLQSRLRRTLLTSLAVTALCASVMAQRRSASPAQDRGADEAAIRAQILANETASNKRDAAGVAATYSVDADLIVGAASRVSGREAIRRAVESGWSTMPGKVSLTVDSIRFLSADTALAEVRGQLGDIKNRATFIMVRRDANWLAGAVRVLPAEQK